MSNFTQRPELFYTADEANAFGRALVGGGGGGIFKVQRVPAAPIEVPGPLGTMSWQQLPGYAVFIASHR